MHIYIIQILEKKYCKDKVCLRNYRAHDILSRILMNKYMMWASEEQESKVLIG